MHVCVCVYAVIAYILLYLFVLIVALVCFFVQLVTYLFMCLVWFCFMHVISLLCFLFVYFFIGLLVWKWWFTCMKLWFTCVKLWESCSWFVTLLICVFCFVLLLLFNNVIRCVCLGCSIPYLLPYLSWGRILTVIIMIHKSKCGFYFSLC